MPKRMFRKYLPSPDKIRQHRSLGFLGAVLSDPNLWHINRHSLAGAAFIGIFSALVPIPLQMVLAAVLAVRFKCNLPLSIVIVWFTNPFTVVPVFYFTYRVGAWLLGMPITPPSQVNFAWLIEQMIPLWVGSILCGLVFGGLAWGIIKLVWRLAVTRSWTVRKRQRRISRERRASETVDKTQSDDNRPS
ncbi:MAG: DUF2062 domain-containing protein [Alcanivoracaceae bacterium]